MGTAAAAITIPVGTMAVAIIRHREMAGQTMAVAITARATVTVMAMETAMVEEMAADAEKLKGRA